MTLLASIYKDEEKDADEREKVGYRRHVIVTVSITSELFFISSDRIHILFSL
jgi:hypothetical protein